MKRHPLDPVSLVIGLLFAGVGAAFLVAQIHIGNANMRWVWPVALLGLGAVMIALGARRAADTDMAGVSPDTTRVPPEEADPTVPG
jgi:hypothetical protein